MRLPHKFQNPSDVLRIDRRAVGVGFEAAAIVSGDSLSGAAVSLVLVSEVTERVPLIDFGLQEFRGVTLEPHEAGGLKLQLAEPIARAAPIVHVDCVRVPAAFHLTDGRQDEHQLSAAHLKHSLAAHTATAPFIPEKKAWLKFGSSMKKANT
jgi:hypothetical protein